MEDLLQSVAQSSFSIAVAAYLLIRMEKKLDTLGQTIQELRLAIVEQFSHVG